MKDGRGGVVDGVAVVEATAADVDRCVDFGLGRVFQPPAAVSLLQKMRNLNNAKI